MAGEIDRYLPTVSELKKFRTRRLLIEMRMCINSLSLNSNVSVFTTEDASLEERIQAIFRAY